MKKKRRAAALETSTAPAWPLLVLEAPIFLLNFFSLCPLHSPPHPCRYVRCSGVDRNLTGESLLLDGDGYWNSLEQRRGNLVRRRWRGSAFRAEGLRQIRFSPFRSAVRLNLRWRVLTGDASLVELSIPAHASNSFRRVELHTTRHLCQWFSRGLSLRPALFSQTCMVYFVSFIKVIVR